MTFYKILAMSDTIFFPSNLKWYDKSSLADHTSNSNGTVFRKHTKKCMPRYYNSQRN